MTSQQIKLYWGEDYVTEGLNKQQTAESHGIVRGFTLAGQSPLSFDEFRLLLDAAKGDSVCCVRNSDNRVITAIVDTDITIDMSTLGIPNGRYWIVCQIDYSIGAPTVGTIEVYTAADMAANAGKYVVLGWVNWTGASNLDLHPGAGTPTLGMADYSLTTGGSTPFMREVARNLESLGRVNWQSMIRHGRADDNMEMVRVGLPAVSLDWKQSHYSNLSAVGGLMEVDDTTPLYGDLHYMVNVKSDGTPAVPVTVILSQKMVSHVRAGDLIKFSMNYNIPAPIPNGWTIGYGVAYFDKDGNQVLVGGAASSLLALDLGGGATPGYVYIENEVHVIDNRSIEYAIPILSFISGDDSGADALFYIDDLKMELLTGRGPELDPTVDSAEHAMQPTKSSVLYIEDWEWDNPVLPTKMDIIAWAAYVGAVQGPFPLDGRTMVLERVTGPAAPPHPILQLGLPYTSLVSGDAPSGSGQRHRKALFRPNTPRAWAAIQWSGVVYSYIDSYGFDLTVGPPPILSLGAGWFRLTFELDEGGFDWIQNQNYSVQIGTKQQLLPPGPGVIVQPVVQAKNVAPRTIDIAIWDGGAPVAAITDMINPGDEIYISIFADD